MYRIFHLFVIVTYFLLPLDASAGSDDQDYVLPVRANEIKIMSYNVQNLFDAEHDRNKQDFEFLPKSHAQKTNCNKSGRGAESCRKLDWTEAKVEMKISQTVKAIAAQGPLPDILVLVEVENEDVVGRLGTALGYDAFRMTNSPDVRGIDCAILFKKDKLEYINYHEREVVDATRPTRNLSTMVFRLNRNLGGGTLAVFANHWPSQGSPTPSRTVVANALRNFVDATISTYGKKSDFHYVITGDFNTIDKDSPHPIDSILFDPRWSEQLVDIRDWAVKSKNRMIPNMPPATYFYGVEDEWNEFDRFLVNRELADGRGLEADPHSYRIHAPEMLSKLDKGVRVPFRYNHNTQDAKYLGYSDHFGIIFKLKYEK